MDAEDDTLMARGAKATVTHEGRVDILAAIDIVERAEESLPFARTGEAKAIAPVGEADLSPGGAGNFVAKVAVDPVSGDAANLPQVVERVVVGGEGGRVTGRADARAVGVFIEQTP